MRRAFQDRKARQKDGETLTNDKEYQYVAAWEYDSSGPEPVLHKEPLVFSHIDVTERKYK
jgi:succinate dehydrogenase / fumarate reductase flavoprotein subunit